MINWDAIAAVAEILAAIGVIGSLVYLAKQIRTNSDNVLETLSELSGLEADAASLLLQGFYFPSHDEQAGSEWLGENGAVQQLSKSFSQFMFDRHKFEQSLQTPEKFIDTQFLK